MHVGNNLHIDTSLASSMETQSQYYSEIDDITSNSSYYTPMGEETGEYEIEMVSNGLKLIHYWI